MSTIGSGVLGAVQAEAPTKGKTGHGKAGEASGGGDFAMAVANLRSRDGEGGRSISGNGERAGSARAKPGHRDAQALAEALGKAGGDAVGEGKPSLDGKTKAAAHAGGRPRAEGHEAAGDAAENVEGTEGEVDPNALTAGETDVGNLLDLLATPNAALPHAGANGAAAFGGAPEGRTQPAGKTAAKADTAGRTDAADLVEADGCEVPQSETDKLFRLIRADGKGRDLDASIGGDHASFRDANPTGPKGETVTVVDSRRYIGLAQAGNAAAVTTAITQDPEWTASLSATGGLTHSEAAATGKVVNTLKIQMHPIELGLVTATLRLHGDELVVSLQVETGEAYRQLADDQDAIVRALRGHGFAVDQVSVQLAPADRSAGTQGDGQGQQQFSSQPQAREGGNGRGQRGDEGAGTFGREGRSHEGNISETAASVAGGQSGRSGGVYL